MAYRLWGMSDCYHLAGGSYYCLGGWGFNYAKQTSDKTAQEMLGQNYVPPDKYIVIGLPWRQKDLNSVVLMIDADGGIILTLIDTVLPAESNKLLKEGNPEQVSSFIQEISRKVASGPGKRNAQVHFNDLRLESVHTAKLKNGKTFPLCAAKAFDKNRNTYNPVVIALLPEAQQHVIIVMGLDSRNTSTDPKARFRVAYQTLEAELFKVINDSDLDDRLQ